MQYFYTFIISFIFIFLSELGDKTQILVLSFSAKNRTSRILIGVALGTLLSHGIAIMFGSRLGIIGNETFISYLKLLTYFTFILFGILGFMKLLKNDTSQSSKLEKTNKGNILKFINKLFKNCIFIVACSIAIGELGDKTFLASIGLGVEYPVYRFSLICGSICGMVASNSIAIFFGKILSAKISSNMIEILSNIIFIVFGIIGLVLR